MRGVTVHEFGYLVAGEVNVSGQSVGVPSEVFDWLERCCLDNAERQVAPWLRLTQRHGRRAVQMTSYVGVIRAPNGFQIEVLPKVGTAIGGGAQEARSLLIEMLHGLPDFRHLRLESAHQAATRMPLWEVFIGEFLKAVAPIIKRGLRHDYKSRQDQLPAMRGKLLISRQVQKNYVRKDRFFTEHDEYSPDRAENRLIHRALRRVLGMTGSQAHQRLAREYAFVFADIPESSDVARDLKLIRLERGMAHYADALAWVRLILTGDSPVASMGDRPAPSLLFPMEAVFEAYVAKHLATQLRAPLTLKAQASMHHLIRHLERDRFRMRPDLLIQRDSQNLIVLDTKWKLLDTSTGSGFDTYGLSRSDFYQLHTYGHAYLNGHGDIVLIYPRTEKFAVPLPVFTFPRSSGLRLWVLPFCLKTQLLLVPSDASWTHALEG